MGPHSEQIEKHIQEQRSELRDNLVELKQQATRAFDWRSQCEQRPMTMIGIAFGAGVLLSALMGGRSRSGRQRPSLDYYPSYANDSTTSHPDVERTATANDRGNGVSATWENLKGAVLGVAAAKLGSAVEGFLPGFREEYRKANLGKSSF